MREIKFRGKSDQDWIYGHLLKVDDCNQAEHEHFDYFIQTDSIQLEEYIMCYITDNNTIGQYTGLKDKNSKEIYEGDIVQDSDCVYEVIFEYGCFDAKVIKVLKNVGTQKGMTYQLSFIISDNDNIRVIGNIYENPELLKGE